LNEHHLGTILLDLLSPAERQSDERTAELRFDIRLLADRLTAALEWIALRDWATSVAIGLFGASAGAACALIAAAERPHLVQAIVSRGGRPDLAGDALPKVLAPTLLIVGGDDQPVLRLNELAATRLRSPHALQIVPGATHLFAEPGKLERVAELATAWFLSSLLPEHPARAARVARLRPADSIPHRASAGPIHHPRGLRHAPSKAHARALRMRR
jgi:dienelactone hydrolase